MVTVIKCTSPGKGNYWPNLDSILVSYYLMFTMSFRIMRAKLFSHKTVCILRTYLSDVQMQGYLIQGENILPTENRSDNELNDTM